MDVAILGNNSLRIKGKMASIVVDPSTSTPKTEAQAIILLSANPDFSDSEIEGSRINIKSPGEYEVSGIKISGLSADGELVARVDADGLKVTVGKGKAIERIQDKLEDCPVLVINADSEFNYSILASLEPNLLIVYGEKRAEVAKALGKESIDKANKFSFSADKLPEDMQLVILE